MNPKLRFSTLFLFCSLCFLPPMNTIAQEYQPMAIEGAHWIVETDWADTPWCPDETYSLTIRGDSVWQGKTYKKLHYEGFQHDTTSSIPDYFPQPYQVKHSALVALIRDSPAEHRVYAVFSVQDVGIECSMEEDILYDFSMKNGEELNNCHYNIFQSIYNQPLVLDSISTTYYQGAERRVLHTKGEIPNAGLALGEYDPMRFIEGFGLENWGILFLLHNSNRGFICHDGLINYCIGTDADCGIITTNIENLIRPNQIKIYSNIVSQSSFWVESQISNISLHLYDKLGQKMDNYSNIPTGKQLIKLDSGLKSGVYFAQIQYKGTVVKTERIIIY